MGVFPGVPLEMAAETSLVMGLMLICVTILPYRSGNGRVLRWTKVPRMQLGWFWERRLLA